MTRQKKQKSLVVQKDKPLFESMTTVMNSSREDIKVAGAYRLLMLSSNIFEVPPQGITIMAGQPYINKVGWKFKLHKKFGKAVIKKNWIHYATPDEKWAIVEATVEDNKGKIIGSAIGEATPESIKLAAVKQTLNMMAETRAKNRAIYDTLIGETYVDAMVNLEKMKKTKQITEQEAFRVSEAAKVTAEEMNGVETPVNATDNPPPNEDRGRAKVSPTGSVNYIDQVKIRLGKLGAKTESQAVKILHDKTGLIWKDFKNVTPKQAQIALAALIQSK